MTNEKSDLRIGLFGGTFNPLHAGHINCILTVKQRLNLDKIVVVPAARNPNKPPVEGPTDEQRLEILRLGLQEFDFVEIDEQELKRGGPSYTVQTVQEYAKSIPPENLYVIVGLDQFDEFDKWRDFKTILNMANLAVASRPGHNLPFGPEDLPKGIQELVAAFDRQFIQLSTERHIEFIRLQDSDASSTEIRKRLRGGLSVDRHLTIPVEEYIRAQGLYEPIGPKIGDYEAFTRFCGDVLFSRKAINVRGFDLRSVEGPAEFTLVASGTSTRHASSLADSVVRAVKEEFGVLPQGVEGVTEGRWVLLDYGSLIVHIFYDFVRQEYRLEELWKQGRDLQLTDKTPASK